jgi:hypothetical protein
MIVNRCRLSLAFHEVGPAIPEVNGSRLSAQLWRGGQAVGGTLDPDQRGRPAGPARWCVLSDLGDGAESAPDGIWLLEQINPGHRVSPGGAAALFIVAMDIAESAEDEFNDWYDTEHIPLLTAVPGVICARRFRTLRGAPRYAAIYHLTDPHAYASAPWCQADQTPWIKRMRRFQSNRQYLMFHPAVTLS